MKNTARVTRALLAATGLALVAGLAVVPVAQAADFSVTANGVASGSPVTDLPQSSQVDLQINNLPAGVGLYAFHCLVPAPGGSPVPTRCDAGDGSLVYVPAGAEQTLTQPITVNATFEGHNPNPMSGDTGTTDVDCRTSVCAIYTLGAGREYSNPAYVTYFPTAFAPASNQQDDRMTATLKHHVIKRSQRYVVHYRKADSFRVTLASGITPSLYSEKCDVTTTGKIRALTRKGTCTVVVTSPGNDDYLPFTANLVFRLKN